MVSLKFFNVRSGEAAEGEMSMERNPKCPEGHEDYVIRADGGQQPPKGAWYCMECSKYYREDEIKY